jgi:hypothetical protein
MIEQNLGDLLGVGMQALTEKRLHLRLANLRTLSHRPVLSDQRIPRISAHWLTQ